MKQIIVLIGVAVAWVMNVRAVEANELLNPLADTGVREVAWNDDIAEGWQQSKRQGLPMLLFVTRDNCYYCTKMKDGTLTSPAVANSVHATFVPVILDGSKPSPLLRELNVRGFPSTFVISPQAVVLDRIDGYVTPEVLAGRLRAVRPRPPSSELARDP